MANSEPYAEFLNNPDLEFVQHECVDLNGTLRGKLSPIKHIAKSGSMINLIFSIRSDENLVITPFAEMENGFRKYALIPDEQTAFVMPWRPGTAAVLNDLVDLNGDAIEFCPRNILKKSIAKLDEHGLSAKVGLEYEFFVFENDEQAIVEGRIRDLPPLGRNRFAYSLPRLDLMRDLAEEIFRRMDAAGAPLEVFHTEYSAGMYEFAFEPLSPLNAADGLARARQYVKILLNEAGYTTTSMCALNVTEDTTSSGVHNNVSLWRDGKNMFWDAESGEMSTIGRQFVAGVMATMQDFHVFFRPWVNSFRRFDPEEFSPTHVAWGVDNHLLPLRVCYGPQPEKQCRLEHRVAGSDTCPHLVLAAILEGGLYGIENELELLPESSLETLDQAPMLASSLPEANQLFHSSQIARDRFGDAFVDHFAQIRSDEWTTYEAWCKEQAIEIDHNGHEVTDWEYQHYFDWL